MLEVIKVVISNRMHVVLFDNDFKTSSDVFTTNNNPLNEFGDLVSRCRSILLNKNDFINVICSDTSKPILLEHP